MATWRPSVIESPSVAWVRLEPNLEALPNIRQSSGIYITGEALWALIFSLIFRLFIPPSGSSRGSPRTRRPARGACGCQNLHECWLSEWSRVCPSEEFGTTRAVTSRSRGEGEPTRCRLVLCHVSQDAVTTPIPVASATALQMDLFGSMRARHYRTRKQRRVPVLAVAR